MKKGYLLELARRHFSGYEIADIHYPDTPFQSKEFMVVKFNLPDNMAIKEYLKFLDEIPKQTPFYPVFGIGFQFAKDTDSIPENAKYIPVWTKDPDFLKEFWQIVEG